MHSVLVSLVGANGLTGGILRSKCEDSTPGYFSVQSALSTLAHQQVTLTVSRLREKFMPFIIFESVTSMSEEAMVSTLKSSLTQLDWVGRPKSSAPFLGSVSNSSFRIMRIIKGRDSFNPMLYGRFHSSNEGTRVKVIMTYHPSVWIFIAVWTSLLVSFISKAILRNDSTGAVVGIFMIAFPWLLGVPLFYNNAVASKRLLKRRLHLVDIQQDVDD